MKNKIFTSLVAVFTVFTHCLSGVGIGSCDEAFADNDGSYPYTKYFSISAYYSPLPGQSHYVTGSYNGDIRLNGRGTNGADGTPVYPGMVAAPKLYSFGTKLYVPGIGMTAVHDRGGAIIEAASDGESGPKYDRLDIWMGYGDKGLTRALNWGLRTVEVTIYGIDESITEAVEIDGYSPDEKHNQPYYYIPEYYDDSGSGSGSGANASSAKTTALFPKDLWYLSEGEEVKKLQEYLSQLGYFDGITNGYFGDDTRMAIYVFQKDKGLVQDIADLGAGHFGPATREAFEEAILSRKEDLVPGINLSPDSSNKDGIKKLQNALKLAGYDVDVTGEYDSKTTSAVFKFQVDNDVLDNAADYGAGYFGPKTLAALSGKMDDLLSSGQATLVVAHADDELAGMIASKKVLAPPMHEDLTPGDQGVEVKRLQQELKNLNLFRIEPTGNYGEVTKHAVFKFQQIHGLVAEESSQYAGLFGAQTRQKMNEIIASKNYLNRKLSENRVYDDNMLASQ